MGLRYDDDGNPLGGYNRLSFDVAPPESPIPGDVFPSAMGAYGGAEWDRSFAQAHGVSYDDDGLPVPVFDMSDFSLGGYENEVYTYDDDGNPNAVRQEPGSGFVYDMDGNPVPAALGGYDSLHPWRSTPSDDTDDDDEPRYAMIPAGGYLAGQEDPDGSYNASGYYIPPLYADYHFASDFYPDEALGGYGRAQPPTSAPWTVRYRATYDRLGPFAFFRYLDGFYWLTEAIDAVRGIDDSDWRPELVPAGSESAKAAALVEPEKPQVIPWNTIIFATVAIVGIAGITYTAPSAFQTAQIMAKHLRASTSELLRTIIGPLLGLLKTFIPGL